MIPYQDREIRTLYKQIAALNRRVAGAHLQGKVAEIKGNKVRLEILPEDSRTGKPFLSPWVQVQESAGNESGGYSTHIPIVEGQKMRLLSPSGEMGPHSVAIRDSYTNDNPQPTEEQQQLVIRHGGASITMNGDEIVISVGDSAVRISAAEILTTAKTRLNNGNRKAHYVGGKDTAGDTAIDGAEVYI